MYNHVGCFCGYSLSFLDHIFIVRIMVYTILLLYPVSVLMHLTLHPINSICTSSIHNKSRPLAFSDWELDSLFYM